MKKSAVHVTDHALLRYLERAMGLDIEWHRRHLGRQIDKVMLEGASGVRIDGMIFRMEGNTVVTTICATTPDPHTGRQRKDRDG